MAGKRRITTASDIAKLGTILSVWAHPDDETFLAAGIMAASAQNGQTVACITATKGEAGSQDEQKWPSTTLANVRAREMANALKVLGIKHHHWLDYRDGACENVSPIEAAARIQKFIEQYKPDSLLTFGPEGMTGHPDHATVSLWVDKAIKNLKHKPAVYHAVHTPGQYKRIKPADEKLNIFFNIDMPPIVEPSRCDIYFELSGDSCKLKRLALAAMPSQTEILLKTFDQNFLDRAFSVESYIRAS